LKPENKISELEHLQQPVKNPDYV